MLNVLPWRVEAARSRLRMGSIFLCMSIISTLIFFVSLRHLYQMKCFQLQNEMVKMNVWRKVQRSAVKRIALEIDQQKRLMQKGAIQEKQKKILLMFQYLTNLLPDNCYFETVILDPSALRIEGVLLSSRQDVLRNCVQSFNKKYRGSMTLKELEMNQAEQIKFKLLVHA